MTTDITKAIAHLQAARDQFAASVAHEMAPFDHDALTAAFKELQQGPANKPGWETFAYALAIPTLLAEMQRRLEERHSAMVLESN